MVALCGVLFSIFLVLSCSSEESGAKEETGFVRLWDEELFLADEMGASPHVRVEYSTVRLDQRPSIVMRAGEEVRFSLDRFQDFELRTAVGLRRSGSEQGAAQVRFSISVEAEDSEPVTLSEAVVSIGEGFPHSAGWEPIEVDLGPLPSRDAELVFSATGDAPGVDAYWGAPTLVRKRFSAARPNVILISLDTLSAGHTSLYGYERNTTPNLLKFSQDAVTFDQAITQHTWTLSAHASMLSSLYPDSHRISLGTAFPRSAPLLPKILSSEGYYALGVVNNPYLNPVYGYDETYDRYDFRHYRKEENGHSNRTIEESNALVIEELGKPIPSPFFLFYHLIDAHSDWLHLPYDAPEPFGSMFLEPGMDSSLLVSGQEQGSWLLAAVNNGEVELSDAQVAYFSALYDGGIAYLDDHLGRFLDYLRRENLYDDSLIIITSDHGEEFLEHGRTLHNQAFEETLRVPLLIKLPGNQNAGQWVREQVSHVDLVPTILEILGIPLSGSLEGESLVGLVDGQLPFRDVTVAKSANVSMTDRDVYTARTNEWKLIWWMRPERIELYNLLQDPGELVDVAGRHPEKRDELMGVIRSHREARNQGLHLRIPAFSFSGNTLEIRFSTESKFEDVHFYNENSAVLSYEPVWVSEDRRELVMTVEPGSLPLSRPLGLDFRLSDDLADISIEALWGEERLQGSRLLLGGDRLPSQSMPLLLNAQQRAVLKADKKPEQIADAEPRLYLWENTPGGSRQVRLSDDEKEALRALGYVVD